MTQREELNALIDQADVIIRDTARSGAAGLYELRQWRKELVRRLENMDAEGPFETVRGSRLVRTSCQDGIYMSTVWVNHGETACNLRKSHTTKAGAIRWANRQLDKLEQA
jgi:hypothetical protein